MNIIDISQFDKLCSLKLIKNDCDTYLKVFETNRDAILSMCILPYLALMCVEAQNFVGSDFFDEPYNKIFQDMRNSLKRFMDRYGKTTKTFFDIDDCQNNHFLNKLRFKVLGKLNVHLNLGVYLDESLNIIGNTHQLASLLNFKKIPGIDEKEKAINIGYQLGSVMSSISNALEEHFQTEASNEMGQMHVVYYIDINTNKKDPFWNNNYSKDKRLYFLHLISFVGFVNNTLSRILSLENLWLLRLRYIACYYCICGLNKLMTRVDVETAEEIKMLIDKSYDCFDSRFRGCMMHYSFADKQGFCIDEKYFDMDIPLYGLVETCFNGLTFDEYNNKLISLCADIETLLKKQFNIDEKRAKLLKE